MQCTVNTMKIRTIIIEFTHYYWFYVGAISGLVGQRNARKATIGAHCVTANAWNRRYFRSSPYALPCVKYSQRGVSIYYNKIHYSLLLPGIERFHHVIQDDVIASQRHVGVQLEWRRMEKLSYYAENINDKAKTRCREIIALINSLDPFTVCLGEPADTVPPLEASDLVSVLSIIK